MRNIRLGIYMFTHFCVDFSCFYMLFTWISSTGEINQSIGIGFLAYNVIAFGLQPVIGNLCDKHNRIPAGIIACILLVCGLFFTSIPVLSIIMMALGNACFHIEGGIDSLVHAEGKMTRSGLFVSTGALGVGLGTLLGRNRLVHLYFPIVLLAICLLLLCFIYFKQPEPEKTNCNFYIVNPKLRLETIILLAFISIVIRAYAGAILTVDWTNAFFALFPSIGGFLGKALGGLLADRFGAKRIGVGSLFAAALILTFAYQQPVFYLLGIILFNMNMSITLCAVVSKIPANPGLAFGITTLALLCGIIPTFFFSITVVSVIFLVLTIASTICLNYMLKEDI